MTKKYGLISLGCPKNLVDSEIFSGIFESNEYVLTTDFQEADFILINTCGFIADAKEEAVNTILETVELKKINPTLRIIATGCFVKRYWNEIRTEIPEVDFWVNLKDFEKMAEILNCPYSSPNRNLLAAKHYAYLRISDGCNNHCSYCSIPSIRGSLHSVPIEELLTEANYLATLGVKELIVIAQDTAQYGTDLYGSQKLPELLQLLHQIENFKWIRVLYLHPAHLTSEIIDTIAALPKVCKYFEVPLQHINDTILQKMNRKITKENTMNRLSEIRTKIPDAVIRTTFIVGFPGETDKRFTELKDFIVNQKFLRMGVFTYSREENTPADKLSGFISAKKAQIRKDELMSIQQEISTELLSEFIGRELEVIIDTELNEGDFRFAGRTQYDAPDIDGLVYIQNGNLRIGDLVKVRIVDSWEYDLVGELVQN
ncbi:MAG: 30S ribosomal protein S12 methylthiotransferase RimO [Candidatus Cloacimonetes bacterium]|nr:30S ribosomal protein S12 methylthiotransferase RimO [Candidatus Cloacimonadota bacterium]